MVTVLKVLGCSYSMGGVVARGHPPTTNSKLVALTLGIPSIVDQHQMVSTFKRGVPCGVVLRLSIVQVTSCDLAKSMFTTI